MVLGRSGGKRAVVRALGAILAVVVVVAAVVIASSSTRGPDEGPPDGVQYSDEPLYQPVTAHVIEAVSKTWPQDGKGKVPVGSSEETGLYINVSHTLVDSASVKDGMTIDDLFGEDDSDMRHLDSIIGQYQSAVPILDVGDGDYLYAYIDPTTMNGAGRVVDADFAEDDNMGHMLDEVEYDAESGVCRIPKTIYKDENGGFRAIRAQLLCAVDYSDPEAYELSSVVDVALSSEVEGVEVVAPHAQVTVNSLTGTIEIPIVRAADASRIKKSDIVVYADGSETPLDTEKGAVWDAQTGHMVLEGIGAAYTTLDVRVVGASTAEAIRASALSANPAFAMEVSQLAAWPWGQFTFTQEEWDSIVKGASADYDAWLYYGWDGDAGWTADAYLNTQAKETLPFAFGNANNGGNSVHTGDGITLYERMCYEGVTWSDIKNLVTQTPGGYPGGYYSNHACFAFTLPADNECMDAWNAGSGRWSAQGLGALEAPAWWGKILSATGRGYSGTPVDAIDDQGRAVDSRTWVHASAWCCHTSRPITTAGNQNPRKQSTIRMRVLEKEETASGEHYLVVGFVTGQVTTQSGCAVYKFKADVANPVKYGSLRVTKSVRGSGSGRSFPVTVTANGPDGTPLSGRYGDMTFSNGSCSFNLANGGTVVANDIPEGSSYVVSEAGGTNYALVSSSNLRGNIAADSTITAALTNEEYGTLRVTKTVTGPGSGRAFDVRIVVNKPDGSAFHNEVHSLRAGQTATVSNIPAGSTYSVTEPTDGSFQVVASSNLTGTISANATRDASITNMELGRLVVKKVVRGKYSGRTFPVHVRIVSNGSTWMDSSKDLANGATWDITGIPAGSTYTVTEDSGNGYVLVDSQNVSGTVQAGARVDSSLTNVEVGNFEVKKVVDNERIADKNLDANREFAVTVTLTSDTGALVSGTYGQMTFANGKCVLRMHRDDVVRATNVPAGYHWDISEVVPVGYRLEGITTNPGEVQAGKTLQSVLTNEQLPGWAKVNKITK